MRMVQDVENVSLKKAASLGKKKVALEQELDEVKSASCSIQQLAENAIPITSTVVDVTDTILAPRMLYGPEMLHSSFSVYKGVFKRLCTLGPNCTVGILAGANREVCDFIYGNSTHEILECQEVSQRWNERNYVVLGMAVLGTPESWKPQQCYKALVELNSPGSSVLLLVQRERSATPECWEVDMTAEQDQQDEAFLAVSLASLMCNKKKTNDVTMCHFSQIGITLMDKLESETHNALLHHVSRSFSQASQESVDNMEMELNPVPADGNCFFHSVLGALNYDRYKAAQRKDNGYAIERHHVQAEEALASKLRSSLLDGDREDAEWRKVVEMLMARSGSVDLTAVPSISWKLGIGLRLTIEPEAQGQEYNTLGIDILSRV